MTVSHINYNNHLTADQSPRQFLLPVLTIYQQMDWDTTINLDGFGNSAQMEWQTVKSWQSFANFSTTRSTSTQSPTVNRQSSSSLLAPFGRFLREETPRYRFS